jgi:tetratricopeptide (TPR) repeat protein
MNRDAKIALACFGLPIIACATALLWMATGNQRKAAVAVREANVHLSAGRLDQVFARCTCRGAAYFNQERFDLALADFDRAIELDPSCAVAYTGRASILTDRGQFEEAMDAVNRAIQLNRRSPFDAAYNNRAQIEVELGQIEQALVDFDAALDLEPHNAIILANRGRAFTKTGNFAAARKDLDRAIALEPTLYRAYQRRAKLHLETGELQAALTDVNETIRLRPNYALAHYTRSLILRRLGKVEEADGDLNEATNLDPNVSQRY